MRLYTYFTSFVFLDEKGEQQFGNTTFDLNNRIINQVQIEFITKKLKKQFNMAELAILNIQLLNEYEVED